MSIGIKKWFNIDQQNDELVLLKGFLEAAHELVCVSEGRKCQREIKRLKVSRLLLFLEFPKFPCIEIADCLLGGDCSQSRRPIVATCKPHLSDQFVACRGKFALRDERSDDA